ncbi:unnamed protein product [Orchesella dallaii]|uniref:Gustatory receptor n=1 Tax=Orchesella dallaii TaxID=48710 RepID=A0ABP1REU1_9HEXA
MASLLVQQAFTFNELAGKYLGYTKFISTWNTQTQLFETHSKWCLWHITGILIMIFLYGITMIAAYIFKRFAIVSFETTTAQENAMLTLATFEWLSAAAFLKVFNGGNYDKVGMMLFYVILFCLLGPHLSVIAMFYTHLDPFYILSRYIVPSFELRSSLIFRLVTASSSLIVAMEISRTLETVIVLAVSVTQMVLASIRKMHKQLGFITTEHHLQKVLYQYELLYVTHTYYGHIADLVAVLMGVGYFTGAVTGAISVVGMRFLHPSIYAVFPMTCLVVVIASLVALPYAAISYEISNELIRGLKDALPDMNGKSKKRRRMKIRALRPIGFKCGSVGNIRKETKTIYLASLLCDTNNILLLLRSYNV